MADFSTKFRPLSHAPDESLRDCFLVASDTFEECLVEGCSPAAPSRQVCERGTLRCASACVCVRVCACVPGCVCECVQVRERMREIAFDVFFSRKKRKLGEERP